jgi:hypothetical protein
MIIAMNRSLHVARDGIELGVMTEEEIRELLRVGFLRLTDSYRTEGTEDWKPLSVFESDSGVRERSALLAKAREKISAATGSVTQGATGLTRKLQSLANAKKEKLTDATQQILEDFTPQIQKLVSNQLVANSLTKAQATVHDDEMMRKIFGAVYDCLPKPVYRFVTETAFIEFCMERRGKLLGLEK